jgi:hypothetical protein
MSCYLVDRKHITYLIEAAKKYEAWIKRPGENKAGKSGYAYVGDNYRHAADLCLSHEEQEILGQMLWDENVRSIEGRYPDTRKNRDYPGTIEAAEDVAYYVHPEKPIFSEEMDFEPVQVFKAIACYDYQSCEHAEWPQSDAYDFCHRLMEAVQRRLPGYDKAAWGEPEPWSTRGPKVRAALHAVKG